PFSHRNTGNHVRFGRICAFFLGACGIALVYASRPVSAGHSQRDRRWSGPMAQKLLQFTKIEQANPDKRTAEERRHDFDEIYAAFQPDAARTQASRCSQCGVPFCQVHCPLNNNIPDWLMLTAEGRLEEAYEISAATNTFPEVCGRICPQDRLCEGNCVIEKGFESVTIGAVERFITDTAFDNGWVKPLRPRAERGQSVGIVGAGPAGLAAAEMLRGKGYQVHVYDRYDRV